MHFVQLIPCSPNFCLLALPPQLATVELMRSVCPAHLNMAAFLAAATAFHANSVSRGEGPKLKEGTGGQFKVPSRQPCYNKAAMPSDHNCCKKSHIWERKYDRRKSYGRTNRRTAGLGTKNFKKTCHFTVGLAFGRKLQKLLKWKAAAERLSKVLR